MQQEDPCCAVARYLGSDVPCTLQDAAGKLEAERQRLDKAEEASQKLKAELGQLAATSAEAAEQATACLEGERQKLAAAQQEANHWRAESHKLQHQLSEPSLCQDVQTPPGIISASSLSLVAG